MAIATAQLVTGGRKLPNPTDKQIVDVASACVTYYGRAESQTALTSQAVWQISRIIYDGISTYTTQFVNNAEYSAIWDDRVSLFDAPGTCTPPANPTVNVAGLESVTTPSIVNIPMPTAGTEYSYALPSGTKRFIINLTSGREFKYGYNPGGPYASRQAVEVVGIDGTVPQTLYFKCNGNLEVMEVDSWV